MNLPHPLPASAPAPLPVRAQQLLGDPWLRHHLSGPRDEREIPRARQVFVNRNLRLDRVEFIGFDMDYTLLRYKALALEQKQFDMTLARLVTDRGYPEVLGHVHYDPGFGMRGLVVDKARGNLVKMDRYGFVGRAWHGRRPVPDEDCRRMYLNERLRIRAPHFAWLDTLFALPEACLYAGVVELMDALGLPVDYGKLYDDIRESIDTIHRDDSLKREIRKELDTFVERDPELGPTLHKLRSGGKRLFLLTNSAWDYTQRVMSYLLDGLLPEYASWRSYFDTIIVSASKPAFFTESRPLLELAVNGTEAQVVGEATSLERGKVYQGGNLAAFERLSGHSGDSVLYVGDHIYGDILKSKKTSLWRTCLIVEELEQELRYLDSRRAEIAQLSELEALRGRLDDEVGLRKAALAGLERKQERGGLSPEDQRGLEEERRRSKQELDGLRRGLKEATALARGLEEQIESGFNPHWGLLFKEGNENSRFGEQVEAYACLYTGRVSNLLAYSPSQYFRSPRTLMAHEQGGALSGKLSPLGREGPPRGAGGYRDVL
ncbi:MAG: HAD-IG family 5'-nucleotidase [Deltaproteobacteria bacterium]|nr:HAD-IG family 5'-nucleotidase [Deltaproteobacteria bacterium]